MVPPSSHPVWRDLITGRKTLRSDSVALNMLLYNAKLKMSRGAEPEEEIELIHRAHALFEKLEFCLQDELAQLLR